MLPLEHGTVRPDTARKANAG